MKALAGYTLGQYRVIGLSLTSEQLEDYVKQQGIKFPVYSEPSHDGVLNYKLGPTPSTIVLSSDGRVLRHWIGAYGGEAPRELEQYFRVTLPGLSPG